MQQRYHSNATTNVRLRSQINGSEKSIKALSDQYGVSRKTVSKWKKRTEFQDKSSRPKTIQYSLSEFEQQLAISIRRTTWLPLDEIAEMINPKEPEKIRSALYRTFVREGINTVPKEQKEKAKKFKEYDPGYLHIDVTYLPKIQGQKQYLFVAIDRATRTLYYKVCQTKTSANAEQFMLECIDFFPFAITHVLTDNGLEFTNHLIKNKKGEYCKKPSKLDVVCQQNNIEHRLTKPFTPKTNGMVEKANDIIKSNTVKQNKYASLEEMNHCLMQFLVFYNLYRRHGSLRKELKVKTPFDAVEKWHTMDQTIFKEKPYEFKKKILALNPKLKQGEREQPCET